MVQKRRRKIEWTINAIQTKKSIFHYWNNRNKSTLYSKKLNLLFTTIIRSVENYPEASIVIKNENIRAILARDYYIIFEVSNTKITILDIWDTRQNLQDFPIK